MHSVCCCSLLVWRKSFLKKGTPRDLFLPHPGSANGRIWPKNNKTCKGPCVLHAYQVSSNSIKRFWRRSWKCESLRTTTDAGGWTDDGQCAMKKTKQNVSVKHWCPWQQQSPENIYFPIECHCRGYKVFQLCVIQKGFLNITNQPMQWNSLSPGTVNPPPPPTKFLIFWYTVYYNTVKEFRKTAQYTPYFAWYNAFMKQTLP